MAMQRPLTSRRSRMTHPPVRNRHQTSLFVALTVFFFFPQSEARFRPELKRHFYVQLQSNCLVFAREHETFSPFCTHLSSLDFLN